jgi:hypothetical protein
MLRYEISDASTKKRIEKALDKCIARYRKDRIRRFLERRRLGTCFTIRPGK